MRKYLVDKKQKPQMIYIFDGNGFQEYKYKGKKLPLFIKRNAVFFRREIENYYILEGSERKFYNTITGKYENIIEKDLNEEIYRKLLSKINRETAEILDVGCGTGIILDVINKYFKVKSVFLTLLDISKGMVKISMEKAKRYKLGCHIKFQHRDFFSMERGYIYDYIFSVFSIPLCRKSIEKVLYLLKNGGKAYIIPYKSKMQTKLNSRNVTIKKLKIKGRVFKLAEVCK